MVVAELRQYIQILLEQFGTKADEVIRRLRAAEDRSDDDFETWRAIRDEWELLKSEGLIRLINGGAQRSVYEISGEPDLLLKYDSDVDRNNAKFPAGNELEAQLSRSSSMKDIVPRVYAASRDGWRWILVEKVKTLGWGDESEWLDKTGLPGGIRFISDIEKALKVIWRLPMGSSKGRSIERLQEIGIEDPEELLDNHFFKKLLENEIVDISKGNCGITADGRAVILDPGFTRNHDYRLRRVEKPPAELIQDDLADVDDAYEFADQLKSALPGAKFHTVAQDSMYPEHNWIEWEGRHYDAETPSGVKDWRDLPIFKKFAQSDRYDPAHDKGDYELHNP